MNVELVLVGTHRGAPRETTNPLTGEPETRAPLVMDDDELRAFRAVLARHGVVSDEAVSVRISADEATVHLDALSNEGATATIDGDIASAGTLLFELVTAGHLLILQHGRCIGTTEAALARVGELEEEFGVAAIAKDAATLTCLLAPQTVVADVTELSLDD